MSDRDKIKLWAAAFLVLVFVYIFQYAELEAGVRFAAAAMTLVAAGALVGFSQAGRSFSYFVRDAGSELRKVVWPSKQEVTQMTGVVFVFLVLVTLFLWLIDLIINFFLGFVIK